MKRLWILALLCAAAAAGAPGPLKGKPIPLPFTRTLLPQIVEMIRLAAVAASADPHAPHYASIGLGKNEYVYSLADQRFIRVIKDRYELPPWQVCGDWASARVELMGESMEDCVPAAIWFLAYRDGRWNRVFRDEEGHFLRGGRPAEVPPYAVRCFNLDHRDLTD